MNEPERDQILMEAEAERNAAVARVQSWGEEWKARAKTAEARAEAAERERDEWKMKAKARLQHSAKFQARSAALEEALAMLWQYYLLPISDEQRAQVEAALAPAPAEETA